VPSDAPVGRLGELREIDSFLAETRTRLRALAIRGPAGIGKTTLWREGVRRATGEGRRVLSARPSGAEVQLSFAGLGDLLERVDPEVFAAQPRVQRHALDVALLRADAGGGPLNRHAVAAGVLSLLRELSLSSGVLVAVDDAQWLDAATADVLAFAVRRLEDRPLGVLVCVRDEDERPDTFERSLPARRRTEVELGGLRVAALHAVLKAELGRAFPRPVLVRIASASGGNPFYALEIARELERTGVSVAGAQLPVPREMRLLARSRLAQLPGSTLEALLVAASLSRPTTALVDVDALAPAEEAGIVRVGGEGRVRFDHPLLASAVYESAPARRRRRIHRLLAERLSDPEEQARHLAGCHRARRGGSGGA
jgi:AAA ATPase domain